MELFLSDIIIHRLLHHFQVRSGPGGGKIHAVSGKAHGIAHVGVGLFPAVVAAPVIVVAPAFKAPLFFKCVAQGKGQVAAPGGIEAGHRLAPPGIRIKALHQGVLSVRGGIGEGIVVVLEQDSLLREFVEVRSQLRVDGACVEALRAQDNQIVVLQHSGVSILVGTGNFGAVVVDGQKGLVLRHGVQGVPVDVHDVVLHFRLHFLHRFRFFRDVISWLFLFGVPGQFQPESGQQAEALGRLVGGDLRAAVIVVVREHLRAPQRQAKPGSGKEQNRQQRQDQPSPAANRPLSAFAHQDQHNQRHKQRQQPGKAVCHGGQQFPPEGGHRVPALGHHSRRVEASKDEIIDDLTAVQHCQHQCQNHIDSKAPLFQERHTQRQQQGDGYRESHGIEKFCAESIKHRPMQQPLPVQQGKAPVNRRRQHRRDFLPVCANQRVHLQNKLFLHNVISYHIIPEMNTRFFHKKRANLS